MYYSYVAMDETVQLLSTIFPDCGSQTVVQNIDRKCCTYQNKNVVFLCSIFVYIHQSNCVQFLIVDNCDQTFIPIKLHKSASRMMQDILVCKIAKQKPLCTTFGAVILVVWLCYAVVNLGKFYQAMLLIGASLRN